MKTASLLIILTLVVLCLGSSALADGFTPVGDPFLSGSWSQQFNDANPLVAFNNFQIVMISGPGFEDPAFSAFTSGGWSSTIALDGLSATASGPFSHNINFNINFLGASGDPLSFEFYAYYDSWLVEYAVADWNGSSWVIREDTYYAAPEPASLMLFGSGLIGVAGVIRRRLGRI